MFWIITDTGSLGVRHAGLASETGCVHIDSVTTFNRPSMLYGTNDHVTGLSWKSRISPSPDITSSYCTGISLTCYPVWPPSGALASCSSSRKGKASGNSNGLQYGRHVT